MARARQRTTPILSINTICCMKNLFLSLYVLIGCVGFAQDKVTIEHVRAELDNFKKKRAQDGENFLVLQILDDLNTGLLQSDLGYCSQGTLRRLELLVSDSSTANWSILFLYSKYQNFILEVQKNPEQEDPRYQMDLVKLLADECMEIYGTIPNLVLIYMTQALINGQYLEKALVHVDYSLAIYPESIPLKVYKVLLDPDGNKSLKKQLLKNHGAHWMVEQKLVND